MRIFILLLAVLALLTLMVNAEVTLEMPEINIYNLGDTIPLSASLKEEQSLSGFFRLTLLCEDNTIDYYVTPVQLEGDVRYQVPLPPIKLMDGVEGLCRFRADFTTATNDPISGSTSPQFTVSSTLVISGDDTLSIDPGTNVTIVYDVRTESNHAVAEGDATITFNNQEEHKTIANGRLSYMLQIPNDLPRGFYAVRIEAMDKAGNRGTHSIEAQVKPIPTRLHHTLEKTSFISGETLTSVIDLLDHASELMQNESISVKILDPKQKPILQSALKSHESLIFLLENTLKPGTYFISSSFKNLIEQTSFTILEHKQITMQQDGREVIVQNIGNIPLREEITLLLRNNLDSFAIKKKLSLDPGESLSIDLSKEVPEGLYQLTLPIRDAITGAEKTITNITLLDNRNIAKKGASSLTSITGTAIAKVKSTVFRPLVASLIIGVLVFGLLIFLGRNIYSMRKDPKKESTEHLFKDFDFDEEVKEKK